MIVAIDGPVGAGKSTVARLVAERLNYLYLNTGAMYRAITLKALEQHVDLEDEDALVQIAQGSSITFCEVGTKICLDGRDVSELIRTPEIDRNISQVVKYPRLREIMVKQQREIGKRGNIVTEGRDQTTVVFPEAEVKIYLDASVDERASRRYKELKEKGFDVTFEQVRRDVVTRDERDKTRVYGPLKIAEDAIVIDTTDMTIDQVVETIVCIVRSIDR